MSSGTKSKTFIYLLGIICCAVVFVLPIWFYGVPRSNDLPQHFQFAASIENSVRKGEIFPNWANAENSGYGGIGLRFYPPASYYFLAGGKLLTGDWFTASCAAFLFWTVLGGFGIYFLAREFASGSAAFVGAIIYIFAPYHATELYGSFMYAEFAAAALLPFCFLFLTRILHKNEISDVFGFAMAFTALIYTHLPLSVIGGLSFTVVTLFSLEKKNLSVTVKRLSLGLLLTLAASSFQWIKVITEMSWLKHAAEKFSAADFYDYRENFLFSFKYLEGLDNDVHHLWFFDLLFVVTLIFTVPFAVIFYRRAAGWQKKSLKGISALAVFTIFVLSPLSLFIWNNFSVLQKVQFPWRWLSIFTICGAVFVAAGFDHAARLATTKQRPLFLILCGCLFVGIAFTGSQIIKQALFIPSDEFVRLTDNIVSRTNNEEWLTIWANKDAVKINDRVSTTRKVETLEWNASRKSFRIEAGDQIPTRISLLYYPYWYAKINGTDIDVKAADDGAMLLDIPPHEATVTLEFIEPYPIKAAIFISLLSSFLLICIYFWTKPKYAKNL